MLLDIETTSNGVEFRVSFKVTPYPYNGEYASDLVETSLGLTSIVLADTVEIGVIPITPTMIRLKMKIKLLF
ncbi:hypothetical protein KKC_12900 [Listeria fleischmannii subsp. coloradonensis]|nr:hypothetical protein KKC_12900 [Listeria fleischmannii subsp. coloradonensis]